MHSVTMRALAQRNPSPKVIARLLDCTECHAKDILRGTFSPKGREHAIIRLFCAVRAENLASILSDLEQEDEWRRIPGYERYEVNNQGMIRRASGGHGSQSGSIRKLTKDRNGYLKLNLSQHGKARTMHAHVAVCLAFNGPQPTRLHVVCHRNDVANDNRAENLYWGTHKDNANDRVRNESIKFGTNLTRGKSMPSDIPMHTIKKVNKEQMLARKRKASGG